MTGPMTPLAPRWLQPTPRSDVRVSWHDDEGVVVVSLWRDGSCVGSAPLPIAEAASLAGFLVGHLGERAAQRRDEQTDPASAS